MAQVSGSSDSSAEQRSRADLPAMSVLGTEDTVSLGLSAEEYVVTREVREQVRCFLEDRAQDASNPLGGSSELELQGRAAQADRDYNFFLSISHVEPFVPTPLAKVVAQPVPQNMTDSETRASNKRVNPDRRRMELAMKSGQLSATDLELINSMKTQIGETKARLRSEGITTGLNQHPEVAKLKNDLKAMVAGEASLH